MPTATICSNMFVTLAKSVATAKGLPYLPLVMVSHPVGGLAPEAVRAKADKVVDGVIRLLTEPGEKLVAEQKAGAK